MSRETKLERARRRVREQRRWIDEHGGDRAGYIARYGSSSGPADERYGDGGDVIYDADLADLRSAEEELAALERR